MFIAVCADGQFQQAPMDDSKSRFNKTPEQYMLTTNV